MLETEKDYEKIVSCSGGNRTLGHPHVFFKIKKGKKEKCIYCRKTFSFDGENHE